MITLIKMKKSFAHTVYMKNSKYKTHPKHSFVLLKKNEGGLIPVPSQATEAVWQLCQGPQSQHGWNSWLGAGQALAPAQTPTASPTQLWNHETDEDSSDTP